jgi:hypothetical protein
MEDLQSVGDRAKHSLSWPNQVIREVKHIKVSDRLKQKAVQFARP